MSGGEAFLALALAWARGDAPRGDTRGVDATRVGGPRLDATAPWPADGRRHPPRLASAADEIVRARALKLALYAGTPEEDAKARGWAVEAFRAVRTHHPDRGDLAAEATFRAGELLRAAGAAAEARIEFETVLELAPESRFGPRARLELAHLDRRAGELERALEILHGLVEDPRTEPSIADDARLWWGSCAARLGRFDAARRAWSGVAKHAVDPRERVVAYDCIGLAWLEEGALDRAQETLEQAHRDLAPFSLERSATGERVRRALELMRIARRLAEPAGDARARSAEEEKD